MSNDNKSKRIAVRISESQKDEFYKLCDLHGLCPSKLIERWIHRFNLNAKKNKVEFSEVYSVASEVAEEYKKYKNS